MPHPPERVIPAVVADAVGSSRAWFVIGGHAVRCLVPYRPSLDVDFGVAQPRDLDALVALLKKKGKTEILERSKDTVHLRFEAVDVSIFVLPKLARFVRDRRLTVTGILATKLHAILDRGTRRDFFDLYVVLEHERLGIVECLSALRSVYGADVNDELLLRALTFFDDADREARLAGEGLDDWRTVKRFFMENVGRLVTPPSTRLAIAERSVGLRAEQTRQASPKRRNRRAPKRA